MLKYFVKSLWPKHGSVSVDDTQGKNINVAKGDL